MAPALRPDRFAAGIAQLLGLIARHGHLRRIAGPLVVLIWNRVSGIGTQVATLLARVQAGHIRRHPARRPARPATRRRPARSVLPRKAAWLIALIPETAGCGAQLQTLLSEPEIPALLDAAPQLRRALRPLCRMLG